MAAHGNDGHHTKPSMPTLKEIFDGALTPRGSPPASPIELSTSLDYIRKNGYYIHSAEAFILKNGREIPDLTYAILGLDGEMNIEAHNNIEKSFDLARYKINLANESGEDVRFVIWLSEI
ncbi:hypothetical protein L1787_16090 [Acuticoccus sp. M5D2P5]|uniref:hypothetical protein n=1 Tax=Acuticoccus kalidii TaxID=2910977 RepID=UPI001F3E990D|nr:hypothetical protein [Acuticoccus kalidii]MCF3934925.1 hypothetical protein [Acuticoccus kalidii]